jgi:DNA-binding NtrC family response regulator
VKGKILIVDDDPMICETLVTLFMGKGYETIGVEDGESFLKLLKDKEAPPADLIFLDVQLPDIDGLTLLKTVKELTPEAIVMIITGFGNVDQSVEAIHLGAADYILKPFNINEILLRVDKALNARTVENQMELLSEKAYGGWDKKYIIGPNKRMNELYKNIERIAVSHSSTVLICGETGTGKEVIAQRVHYLSQRSKKPFVEVNATALTAELLESELFGHEAGSFTGATKRKKGLFEVADGGTLFLDEIGDMDMAMQAKILRALQEKKIRRVGGTEHIDVDIRLVTATNKDLVQAVKDGTFREDLYYRLNVIFLELPPLRERKDDIEILVKHFVDRFNVEFRKNVETIDPEALECLKEYPWPGNIRELGNMIERAMLLDCEGSRFRLQDLKLPKDYMSGVSASFSQKSNSNHMLGAEIPLEHIEREHIAGVLKAHGGNKNQTAQVLGIDRTTLYNKLKKYQI